MERSELNRMVRQKLDEIMEREPTFGCHGYECGKDATPERIECTRRELRNSIDEIVCSIEFLELIDAKSWLSKSFECFSYEMKDLAEVWYGRFREQVYIPNGCMIVAFKVLEIPTQHPKGHRNEDVALSRRLFRRIFDEAHGYTTPHGRT